MVEPVYGTVIQAARLVWRLQGLKFTITGVENLPVKGGAVVAINHTSYFDFTFAGLPAYKQHRGRKVRFMAKKEVFDSQVSGPIMRSLRHIPVDRDSGAASFAEACQRLKEGELVGVYPEATISRSFEIKEFKSGAARMAIAADVPIIPHIVWGAQRIWTKGHPRKMARPKVPISITVGEPIYPTLPAAELTALLHSRMQHLLERVQDAYGPHPAGEFWVPHRLGGGAPTLAEANRMDLDEASREGGSPRRTIRAGRAAGIGLAWNRSSALWRSRAGRRCGSPAPGSPTSDWRTSRRSAGRWWRSTTPATSTSSPRRWPRCTAGARLRFMIKAEMQEVRIVELPDQALQDHPGGPPRRCGTPTRWPSSGSGRANWSACTRRPPSAAASS